MRYIEIHRRPAAYVLGPPPSRGGDLELEGSSQCMPRRVHIWRSARELPHGLSVLSNGVVEISLLHVCTGDTSIKTRSSYQEAR